MYRFLLTLLVITWFTLSVLPVQAHGEDAHGDFRDIAPLLDGHIPCDALTEDQLERIGDFYMEEMHPGAAHTRMDQMMGGEGSASLRAAHTGIARRLYCGDEETPWGMMAGGMMGMMRGTAPLLSTEPARHDPVSWWGSGMPYGGWGFMAFVWIFLLLGIAAFVKVLVKK